MTNVSASIFTLISLISFYFLTCSADRKLFEEGDTNYCKLRCPSKNPKDHTVCRYLEKPGPRCNGKFSYYPLTWSDRMSILDLHNDLRRRVALGTGNRNFFFTDNYERGTASNMMLLKWDPELAFIAQRWANQCEIINDDCHSTSDEFNIGQNIGYIRKYSAFKNIITQIVFDWYSSMFIVDPTEKAKDEPVLNEQPYSNEKLLAFRPYYQILWGTTRYIGCGRGVFIGDPNEDIGDTDVETFEPETEDIPFEETEKVTVSTDEPFEETTKKTKSTNKPFEETTKETESTDETFEETTKETESTDEPFEETTKETESTDEPFEETTKQTESTDVTFEETTKETETTDVTFEETTKENESKDVETAETTQETKSTDETANRSNVLRYLAPNVESRFQETQKIVMETKIKGSSELSSDDQFLEFEAENYTTLGLTTEEFSNQSSTSKSKGWRSSRSFASSNRVPNRTLPESAYPSDGKLNKMLPDTLSKEHKLDPFSVPITTDNSLQSTSRNGNKSMVDTVRNAQNSTDVNVKGQPKPREMDDKAGELVTEILVCNYKVGTKSDTVVYKIGKPCSDCPTDSKCSQRFRGLCYVPDSASKLYRSFMWGSRFLMTMTLVFYICGS